MEGKKHNIELYSKYFIALIFTVGIFGHLYLPLKNLFYELTPFTLLLLGALVLFNESKDNNRKLILWASLVFVITFILEVAGVKTKMIFGDYYYGSTLGFKLFDVPLIIGFNWVIVILGAVNLSSIIKNKYSVLVAAPIIALLFDLILEPMAIKLNYWQWKGDIIPIQNYIAWYLIALVSVILFSKMKLELNTGISRFYLIAQFVFFITLLIFMR